MGSLKKLQESVNEVFTRNFGYTPFSERMKDIANESLELQKWNSIRNVQEELGDLMASCIQLANESGWSVEDLVGDTLKKIDKRYLQYKSLGRKYKIAILGGAFDPITKGHIEVAKFVLNTSGEFDEVWIMPAYKHLYNKPMVDSKHRLVMAELAAKVDRRIKIFDYEIRNELSGETFNLFKRLKEEKDLIEQFQFAMIIGMDNALTFKNWVNNEELERFVRFVIVPRKGVEMDYSVNWFLKPPHVFLNDESIIPEISSSQIREMFKEYYSLQNVSQNALLDRYDFDVRNDILEYLDEDVFDYIIKNNLYK